MTRIALRIPHDTPCPECGYNLRGLRLDRMCPECGRPTADTFARPVNAVDATLASAWLTRGGQALAILAFAGWAARLPTFGLTGVWASAASVIVVAIPAAKAARGWLRDASMMRLFRSGRSIRPYAAPVMTLLFAGLIAPLAAASIVQNYLPFVTILGGGFVAVGAALGLSASAASDLLRRGSHPTSLKQGRVLLPLCAVLAAAGSIPIKGAPWFVPLAQGAFVFLMMLAFLFVWRRYDLALSRAQGPVSSL